VIHSPGSNCKRFHRDAEPVNINMSYLLQGSKVLILLQY
jgi:hypothetical protein